MMDMIEFSKCIPPDKLAMIFKDFFEEHIAAYYIFKGLNFIKLSQVDINKISIVYSAELMDDENKQKLVYQLQNQPLSVSVYGHVFIPSINIVDDIIYITINK